MRHQAGIAFNLLVISLAASVNLRGSDLFLNRSNAILDAQGTPKIDTYVINQDNRTDRCECIQQQLDDAPQSVYRQSSVKGDSCPKVTFPTRFEFDHSKSHWPSQQSLFCSNYQIWQRANQSDADFIVILEDDALLKPHFWPKVFEFIQGCASFDYVVVDPIRYEEKQAKFRHDFWNCDEGYDCVIEKSSRKSSRKSRRKSAKPVHGKSGNPVQGCPEGTFRRIKSDSHGWDTTTMTIIRKGFLPTLMQTAEARGWGAMDDWWQILLTPISNAYGWRADIVVQASVGMKTEIDAALSASGCNQTMSRSNIGLGTILRLNQGMPERLRCP